MLSILFLLVSVTVSMALSVMNVEHNQVIDPSQQFDARWTSELSDPGIVSIDVIDSGVDEGTISHTVAQRCGILTEHCEIQWPEFSSAQSNTHQLVVRDTKPGSILAHSNTFSLLPPSDAELDTNRVTAHSSSTQRLVARSDDDPEDLEDSEDSEKSEKPESSSLPGSTTTNDMIAEIVVPIVIVMIVVASGATAFIRKKHRQDAQHRKSKDIEMAKLHGAQNHDDDHETNESETAESVNEDTSSEHHVWNLRRDNTETSSRYSFEQGRNDHLQT